jgi:hypothetical protein
MILRHTVLHVAITRNYPGYGPWESPWSFARERAPERRYSSGGDTKRLHVGCIQFRMCLSPEVVIRLSLTPFDRDCRGRYAEYSPMRKMITCTCMHETGTSASVGAGELNGVSHDEHFK